MVEPGGLRSSTMTAALYTHAFPMRSCLRKHPAPMKNTDRRCCRLHYVYALVSYSHSAISLLTLNVLLILNKNICMLKENNGSVRRGADCFLRISVNRRRRAFHPPLEGCLSGRVVVTRAPIGSLMILP